MQQTWGLLGSLIAVILPVQDDIFAPLECDENLTNCIMFVDVSLKRISVCLMYPGDKTNIA